MQLRPYQTETVFKFYATTGNSAIIAPTGSGKTVMMSDIIKHWEQPGYIVVLAHRQELVSQISGTLARDGIHHTIMASKTVTKECIKIHIHNTGKSFYRIKSRVIVASVQTLVRREEEVNKFANNVGLAIVDEMHHVLKGNIWGRAFELFPNARALGFTATPIRCDKKALGAEYDGIFHNLIISKSMIELMNEGFLCRYKVYCPAVKTLDLSKIKIGSTGDYTQQSMSKVVEEAKIHANIVESYKKHANGKRGVTFVPSVKIAGIVAQAFKDAGVPAAVVSAKTPPLLRIKLVEDLRDGRLLQLVNVDLFGEGFDLPAIECVIMARPTASYALFSQQLGRALRPAEGKDFAIIIDLVGNVVKHGLPEFIDQWTLGYYGEKGPSGNSLNKWKACCMCTQVFERYLKVCPHCGYQAIPEDRGDIEMLDGDLTELDPAVLAELRAEKLRQYGNPQIPYGVPSYVKAGIINKWNARKEQLDVVKWMVNEWTGRELNNGLSDGEVMRKFFLTYQMDVLSAMTCREVKFLNKLEDDVLC